MPDPNIPNLQSINELRGNESLNKKHILSWHVFFYQGKGSKVFVES